MDATPPGRLLDGQSIRDGPEGIVAGPGAVNVIITDTLLGALLNRHGIAGYHGGVWDLDCRVART